MNLQKIQNKEGGVPHIVLSMSRMSTGTMMGIFHSSVRLIPKSQSGTWEKQSSFNEQNTKHMQIRSDTQRSLQPSIFLGDHPEDPQIQYDCAHFRGEETKAQRGTAVPKVTLQVSGKDSAACGLAKDQGKRICSQVRHPGVESAPPTS